MLNKIASGKKNIAIITSVFLIITTIIAFFAWVLNQKTFYMGIKVENISLSGIGKLKAWEKIQDEINKNFAGKKLILKHGDKEWNIGLNEISYSFLVNNAIEDAYRIGREGNFINRLMTVYRLRKKA